MDDPDHDQEPDDRTELEEPDAGAVAPRREPLPWVLFFATLIIFSGVTLMLYQRATGEADKTAAATAERDKAQAAAKTAEGEVMPLRDKISSLETQLKALQADRDALADKLKAKPADEPKPDDAKKPAAKKPAAKPPAKKKKK